MSTVHNHATARPCNDMCYEEPSIWAWIVRKWNSMFTGSLYPEGK